MFWGEVGLCVAPASDAVDAVFVHEFFDDFVFVPGAAVFPFLFEVEHWVEGYPCGTVGGGVVVFCESSFEVGCFADVEIPTP